jgi:hypothetical protein
MIRIAGSVAPAFRRALCGRAHARLKAGATQSATQNETRFPRDSSNQRDARNFRAARSPLALAHFHAQHVGQGRDAPRNFTLVATPVNPRRSVLGCGF